MTGGQNPHNNYVYPDSYYGPSRTRATPAPSRSQARTLPSPRALNLLPPRPHYPWQPTGLSTHHEYWNTMDPSQAVTPQSARRDEVGYHSQSPATGSPSFFDSSFASQQSQLDPDTSIEQDEDRRHPKSRRKRTSAEDKEALDRAYESNAKPDKQERQAIVAQVSMTEKEVQIWFQNRRQNDRRRSRPLSSEDLVTLYHNSITANGSSSPFANSMTGLPPQPVEQTRRFSVGTPHDGVVYSFGLEASPAAPGHSYSHSFPRQDLGYLSNRRNAASIQAPTIPNSQEEVSPPNSQSRSLKRKASFRISYNLDGQANVVNEFPNDRLPPISPTPDIDNNINTSSINNGPPRPRSFQRSQSERLPPLSAVTAVPGLHRSTSRGHARDVSNWESCADIQRQDPLITMAENESTGSAAAAIHLIRSSSATGSNGVLQPSSSARHNRRESTSRPQQRQEKRPRLTSSRSDITHLISSTEKRPADKTTSVMLTPGTDSDKENMSPDEDGISRPSSRRRPLPIAGPVDSDGSITNRFRLDLANMPRLPRLPAAVGAKEGLEIYEDNGDEGDEHELPRPDAPNPNSPNKRGMEDCVNALLSLSRGGGMR